MSFFLRALKPKALTYPQEVLDELNVTLRSVADSILLQYDAVTRSWNNPPEFTVEQTVNANVARIDVWHDSQEFRWVDRGTKSHRIGQGMVSYSTRSTGTWFSKPRISSAEATSRRQTAKITGKKHGYKNYHYYRKHTVIVRSTQPTHLGRLAGQGTLKEGFGGYKYREGLLTYPVTNSGGTVPPKTLPGWMGSRPSMTTTKMRSSYFVHHPGIAARGFTAKIKAGVARWEKRHFYNAIRRGFYRARHK